MGFAENLRVLRKAKQMTQEEVARRVGVRRQTIIDWENPEGKRPGFFHLIALVTVLETSWYKLMDGEVQQVKEDYPNWRRMHGLVNALRIYAKATDAVIHGAKSEFGKEEEIDDGK